MGQERIAISIGHDTEKLIKDIVAGLDDTTLDALDIDRKLESSEGLSGEPITIFVTFTASAAVLSAVVRLIERHLDNRKQITMSEKVLIGYEMGPDAGAALKEMALKYSDVSISYGIATESWRKQV